MISSFKTYLIEEEKTVYFTFGRMNPPTIGHEKLLQSLSKQAGNNPYKIYLSNTQDSSKNPLPYKEKIKFARKMFPRYARQVIIDTSSRNIFDILTKLYNDGFKNVAMVVGSDRLREFNILLNKYNGKKARHGFYNFNKINVLSAGDRDPDADGAKGMSASKMRSAASSNDFTTFSQGLPKGVSNPDAKALYNAVRKGMGLKEQRQFKNHIQLQSVSNIRESYVNGSLYNIGDSVVINATGETANIRHLGSNYVILEGAGKTKRKWLNDISLTEKMTTRQDPDIADKKGTQPAKYHKGLKPTTKAARDAQFKKQAKMADDNPNAYKDAPGDKEARKKGMPISKHTKFTNKMLNQSATPSEMTVGNYTTKYYYMCPSAKKAMTKHSDVKGAEELTRLQDDFFKFEEQFINSEPNIKDKVKADKMYDQIIQKAKQAGIEKDVDSYMIEHRNSIVKGDPKPGFGKINEDAVKMAKKRIDTEKSRDKTKFTRIINRATIRKAVNQNRERLMKNREANA